MDGPRHPIPRTLPFQTAGAGSTVATISQTHPLREAMCSISLVHQKQYQSGNFYNPEFYRKLSLLNNHCVQGVYL